MSESERPGAAGTAGHAGPGGEAGPDGRRWVVLFAGLVAMTAGCTFQYGLAYLIPAFRAEGLSLEQAGILVACPTAGLLLTLVAWGAAADRWGERLVLGAGLALAGTLLVVGATVHGTAALGACLVAAGAAGASVYAASGRLILGWFPARQRGLAMGIRQSAQPLGVAVAALALPSIGAHGRAPALTFLGTFCLAAAVLVAAVVRDPARPPRQAGPQSGSPYRGGPHRTAIILWRIHAASALLVVPQFAVATFALVFLVDAHGLDPVTAGRILAVAQACGAFSRLGAGVWSDRVGSRMRPMRALAVATAVILAALAAGAAVRAPWAVAVLFAAVIISVSTNGLAFTAVAEHAGSSWAGRALGIQNTGQNAFAAATPPVLAAVIGAAGYAVAFGVVALFPLAAAGLVPVSEERWAAARASRAGPPPEPAGPGRPASPPGVDPAAARSASWRSGPDDPG
jgi:MFS family permease